MTGSSFFHTKSKVIFINLSSEFILLLLLKVINQTSVISACEFCVFTGNEDTGGLSAIEWGAGGGPDGGALAFSWLSVTALASPSTESCSSWSDCWNGFNPVK